jgi:hypothetical protein
LSLCFGCRLFTVLVKFQLSRSELSEPRLSQANLGVALVAVISARIAKLVLTFFNQSDTLSFAFYDIFLSTLWLWSVIA